MTIAVIAAVGNNRELGEANQLPWHLPDDLKRFKQLTTGHAIIMGRKTYDSIGRPLPNRTNIVVTRNPNLEIPGCIVVHSLDEALAFAGQQDDDEVFIIGGAQIYDQAVSKADTIHLTEVDTTEPNADVFFPEINPNEWELVERQDHEQDDKHDYPFTHKTFKRVRL